MQEKDILEKYNSERQECECWCRCMGYYRPVSHYNIGKKQEFADRTWFTEEKACLLEKEQKVA